MNGNKPLIYFDSCIWIGIITGELRKDNSETAALSGLIKQLEEHKIVAVSSTLIKVEVLDADMTEQQKSIFEGVIRRKSSVQIMDSTAPIMELAGDIRNYYKKIKSSNLKAAGPPKTPDAIHLATAIYYECDVFFTLDDPLLSLINPIVGKYSLKISKPFVDEPGLNL